MEKTTLRVEEDTLAAVDDEAETKGMTRSQYLRWVIENRHRIEGDSPELEARVAELEDELHAIRQLLDEVAE